VPTPGFHGGDRGRLDLRGGADEVSESDAGEKVDPRGTQDFPVAGYDGAGEMRKGDHLLWTVLPEARGHLAQWLLIGGRNGGELPPGEPKPLIERGSLGPRERLSRCSDILGVVDILGVELFGDVVGGENTSDRDPAIKLGHLGAWIESAVEGAVRGADRVLIQVARHRVVGRGQPCRGAVAVFRQHQVPPLSRPAGLP
jgi:hypothetical protein